MTPDDLYFVREFPHCKGAEQGFTPLYCLIITINPRFFLFILTIFSDRIRIKEVYFLECIYNYIAERYGEIQ